MAAEKFSSKMGAIAAAAGSAVGLGNIWRFPYIVGEDGGAAFLLLYVLLTIVIAIPVLMTELALGRASGQPVTSTFQTLYPKGKWYLIGVGGILTAFLILSFYSIVSGWTIYYSIASVAGWLNGLNDAEYAQFFSDLQGDPTRCIIWMALALGATAVVVARGVSGGIEKYSKILMPLLFLLLIAVLVRAVTLDGAGAGLSYFLFPDFSKLTAKAFFDALGQSFFSLSIGMGTMTTYGSYVRKTQDLPDFSVRVASVDFLVAFLSGAVIFPCVFAFGINPGEGPGLVFVTLSNVFNQMPLGSIFETLFFVLLVVAAITSSISLLEVIVAYLKTSIGMGRRRAAIFASVGVFVFGVTCALFPSVFNAFDVVTANVLMPLGAFFIVIFATRILPRERLKAEIEAHGLPYRLFNVFYFLVRYVVPFAILIIFVQGVLSWFGIGF